jgi:hypothetical protein
MAVPALRTDMTGAAEDSEHFSGVPNELCRGAVF